MKKNINQILDNPYNIKIYWLPCLIASSFLLRLLAVYFVRDMQITVAPNTINNSPPPRRLAGTISNRPRLAGPSYHIGCRGLSFGLESRT